MKRLLVFFLILLFQCGFPYTLSADSTIKVGVYNNEPLLFSDAAGKGKGVFADIIEHVASKEGWRIEYVTGTWDQCLSRLENNQIDILGTIGFTKARDKLYDFGKENLMTNWGQLYTPAGSDIRVITDVAGKKVAALNGDIHYRVFAQIIERFGIECEFIETDNYSSVLDLVSHNQADAGVVNRFFGMKYGSKYKLDKSGVIFNPIKLYYAVPEGKNIEFINTIDRYITSLKSNENSEYYRSLDRWFEAVSVKRAFPKWAKWTILVSLGLVIFLFLGNLVLRIQVRTKTKELTTGLKERRKAEEALRHSEERYRRLTENAKDMIYRMSLPDGRYEYVSPASVDLFGYTPTEFYDSPVLIQKAIHPEWQKYFEVQWARLMVGDMPPFYEYQIIHKSGENRWLNQRNVLISDDSGRPIAIEGIVTDITDRKRAERSLRESEEKYRSLYEKSADAVLIYKNRRFIDCNQAAIDMLNLKSKEQFLNCSAADISPEFQPDGRRSEEKSAEMDATAFEKGSHIFEWLHKRATGEEFPVEVMLTSIKEYDEMYFHVIWRDITERKQAEEELAKYRKHLEELVKQRTTELEEKNAELERMNEVFTGREFRIKELKKEIKRLKG